VQDGAVTDAPKPLTERIVRGSVWTAARQGVQQASSLVQLVVLARLLPPAEVGLFAMASLVLTITRALTETGLEQALIQRAELDDETLDVGFSVVLLRAALVATLMAGGATLFAGFFNEPRVAALLRVLAISMLIEGFISNRMAVLQRSLDFRSYFFFQAAGQLVGLITTIVCAFWLRNVWAVVYGQLAASCARVVASYLLVRRRPRLRFELAKLRELMRYGRWVGASSVLLFLLVNGDNLFIGKLIGASALAYYAWAYQLANLPPLFVTQILSSVMFPALASVRSQPARLGELFLRSMKLTLLLTLPSAGLIAMLCETFTRALLGERWLPIVPITYALTGFGVMRAMGASAGALFLALGRPDLRTKIMLAQLVVFSASIFPLYQRFGVLGVAWAVTAYGCLSVYAAYLCFGLCGLPISRLARPALQVSAASASGALAAWLTVHSWLLRYPLAALVAGSCSGVAVTIGMLFWLDRRDSGGYRHELTRALHALRKR
jgi:lipopolysaccharide exporter